MAAKKKSVRRTAKKKTVASQSRAQHAKRSGTVAGQKVLRGLRQAVKHAKAAKRRGTQYTIRCSRCGNVFEHDPGYKIHCRCPECHASLGIPEARRLYLLQGGTMTTEEQKRDALVKAAMNCEIKLTDAIQSVAQLRLLAGRLK